MASKADLVYEDRNVYVAALDRLGRIYSSHDEVWVSYSGGKDSLACLKLCEEYLDSIGSKEKINVIFRDEEVIQGQIRDFVLSQVDDPRYNFVYLATPLHSEIYVLGSKEHYIQWDDNRKWIVDKPKCAQRVEGVWKQEEFDKVFFQDPRKKICNIIGLRADESLLRFQGITSSTIPYLTKSSQAKHVNMGKPIYDWSEKDIFKYFYDNKIQYCKVYDHQVFNRDQLRVASAIHSEAAKNLYKLKTIDPELYNQIMEIFPQVDVQARYYNDMLRGRTSQIAFQFKKKAGDHWSAILLYIKERITDPPSFKSAMRMVAESRRARKKNVTPENPFGGYPALYIFGKVIGGGYKRNITPTPDRKQQDYDFEDISNRA